MHPLVRRPKLAVPERLSACRVITSPDHRDPVEIPYHMAQLLARTAVMTALIKQGHCLKDICETLDNNPQLIEDALAKVIEEQNKPNQA